MKDETISHCSIINYPDGQRNVQLDMDYYDPKQIYILKCRIKVFADLELLGAFIAACIVNDIVIKEIQFIYLMGMRCDRSFSKGMPNYFRDVLGGLLKSIDIPKKIFMPHNEIVLNYAGAKELTLNLNDYPSFEHTSFFTIGADQNCHFETVAHFIKKRDLLTSVLKINNIVFNHFDKKIKDSYHLLIMDDLCDGGATFVQIADYLDEHYPNTKRSLLITHGLFTRGIDIVADRYERIYVTNSYQDFDHQKVEVLDVWGNN